VFQRKKPRKNYRRGKKAKRRFAFLHRFFVGFKIVGGLALLTATSALFIFVHDVVTQCDYFKARHLIVEGNQRLSKARIADQAQVSVGMNILAVNLTATRKHLLAHPWIAEAEVIREIPSGLRIRLKEHVPLAIVDLGRKFLINESGEIFKEWTPADPSHFPVVSGLQMSDIATYAKRKPRPFDNSSLLKTDKLSEDAQNHYSPLDAVMHVLRLGKGSESILPNHLIKQIRVDPEIGLTLHARTQVKTIKLGYDHYADKYNMLKHIIVYLKKKQNFPVFDRIDLNNLNRIVVSPKRRNAPAGEDKEV
jgi:cell division protein FtsQ